jgi:hypothetical protein
MILLPDPAFIDRTSEPLVCTDSPNSPLVPPLSTMVLIADRDVSLTQASIVRLPVMARGLPLPAVA